MKVFLLANTDWYLYNFRISLAEALRADGHEVVLLSPRGKYAEKLEHAGFRWIEVPLDRRRLNPFAELKTIAHLTRVYRRERPDLAHHFTIKCVLYGTIAARLSGITAIVNALAGLGLIFSDNRIRTRLLRWMIRLLCRLVLRRSQVVFQNPEDYEAFRKYAIVDANASHLIRGSGVDAERFKPRGDSPKAKARCCLLASRLLWAKGVADYVEAARVIRQQVPDSVFLVAGESDPGNPDAVPGEVIAGWKREGHVVLLGHCDDMQALLARVDLVALPTYYGEGVPRILIEAAAAGLPLVATDMPGCREIVHHGANGFLVPPKDPKQLASAIKELLIDDDLRARMGQHSRELARNEFSEAQVIEQTLRVYQSALSAGYVARPSSVGAESLK